MDKYIIALDPGKTTGVSVLRLTASHYELVGVGQWDNPTEVYKKVKGLLESFQGKEVYFICESFEMRPDVVMPDETPKYIIHDLNRFVAPDYPIIYQTASRAKGGVPPTNKGVKDRLHAFNLYNSGMRHANDATRHAVTYAIKELKHRPLIKQGWG